VLSPGLRIGWIVADKPLIAKLIQVKRGANLCSSIFDQFVAYEAAREGFLDDHIVKLRGWYKVRRDAMVEAMERYFPPEVIFTRPKGGFFIMVTLPEPMDAAELLKLALEQGVAYVPGESVHLDGIGSNTLRLSFSRYAPEIIDEGIRRLAVAIKTLMA
jgi:2-aminoadipate transaminase